MHWQDLSTLDRLDHVDALSAERPVMIFKHSTRCSISKAALNRLERNWSGEDAARHPAFLLDLLAHRAVSNAVAERYQVRHESPQVLVIRDGRCTYSATHTAITYADVLEALGA